MKLIISIANLNKKNHETLTIQSNCMSTSTAARRTPEFEGLIRLMGFNFLRNKNK